MHPDFLQAAADERIARLHEVARQSRLLRAARARIRRARGRDEDPGGGTADALPERQPSVSRTAPAGTTPAPGPATRAGDAPENAAERAPAPC
ncbi:hypothetical protein [Streptomonospora arabica]|uniref:Uncharacterized protein n=1 Tax=Streptomonospora arabica TaxID=412417 RepID=A0ABV9SGI9_9ACTN